MQEWLIRQAVANDVPSIAACVKAAYQHYIPRLGKPPGPMLDDYAQAVQKHHAYVAVLDSAIIGLLVLIQQPKGILLDNIAVHPSVQGQGLGKRLMEFAEQQAQTLGYTELQLYTHIKMTENIAIYTALGYTEIARRNEQGYQRVYMAKRLNASK